MKSRRPTITRFLFAAVITAFLVAITTCSAEAFGPRQWFRRGTNVRINWQHPPGRAPSYMETYHYMNSRYPKYYGGFHASYFDNMGIPPGDIGLRGNGLYMTPW